MASALQNITTASVSEVNSLYSFFLIDVIFKELAIRNPLTLKTITLYREDDFDGEILERIITFLSITYHPWIGINLARNDTPIRNEYDILHKPNDVIHLFLLSNSTDLHKLRLKERLSLTSNSVIIGFNQKETRDDIQAYYKLITDETFNSTNLKRVTFVTLDRLGDPLVKVFDVSKAKRIGMEDEDQEQDLKKIKIPKVNMNGEAVTVYMVTRLPKAINVEPDPNHPDQIVFTGRDGLIASMLSNYFNASLIYRITPESLVRQEGNISQMSNVEFTRAETGPLGMNITADLLMNSRMCCDYSTEYSNFYPHEFDSYYIYVPRAQRTAWHLDTFSPWLAIVGAASVTIFTLLWYCFRAILNRPRRLGDMVFRVIGSLLQTDAVDCDRSQYSSERLLTACILIFALVSTIFISADVYEDLLTVKYDQQIQTNQELQDSNLSIIITPEIQYLFEEGIVESALQQKMIVVNYSMAISMIYGKNMSNAYVLRRSRGDSLLESAAAEIDGRPAFYRMEKPIAPSMLAYHALKSFLYKDEFDQINQRIIEAGFMSYFSNVSDFKLYFKDRYRKEIQNARQDLKLEFSEITSLIAIYMVGNMFAFLVLLFEIFWYKQSENICNWINRMQFREVVEHTKGTRTVKDELFEYLE